MTLPEPASDELPDEEWLEESLLKKLDRDDQRLPPLPPDDELRLLQVVVVGVVVVTPGAVGSQLDGISV